MTSAMRIFVRSFTCSMAVSIVLADIFFQPQTPAQTTNKLLGPSVNLPPVLSQEDAVNIERYLRNYDNNYPDKSENQPTINLASLNSKGPMSPSRRLSSNNNNHQSPPEPPYAISSQPSNKHVSKSHAADRQSAYDKNVLSALKFTPPSAQHRLDGSMMSQDLVASPSGIDALRRGKMTDALMMKPNLLGKFKPQPIAVGHSPLTATKKLMAAPGALLPPDCISQSTSMASRCEDHLVRRLNQDAAEGRTVIDVSRRVCCALFYHKDCISRIVVERCPDSSPAAVDILMGSRNLDLTFSCQRFNRDGCNGARTRSLVDKLYIAFNIMIAIATCARLTNQMYRL